MNDDSRDYAQLFSPDRRAGYADGLSGEYPRFDMMLDASGKQNAAYMHGYYSGLRECPNKAKP